ncbi:TPA: Eac protein [Enterobacter cloacae subsp. cloacae]|uniref:Eac protein n=1 Tax=Enterobacter cloacae TaxID=550 RepID=UPI0028EC2408|nr:Eac protein [Enterobacter cloacae]WNT23805.1 Eac protein [Enterobacter cloacae]HED4202433.1 Eac protein [Enterobacter cloacae subsp. cloacae]
MSDQSKYYDYYMVEGDDVKMLIKSYDTIRDKRNALLPEAVKKVGAIAWTTTSNWGGGGGLLENFVWEKDFKFPCPMTIKREDFFYGKRVVIARGKGNTKEGRAYNKELDAVRQEVNKELKSLPEWEDFIINHYGIMRTGIGGQSGKGFAMLSTHGGRYPGRYDALLFRIPNDKSDDHFFDMVIPENFKKMTYGQFYDIVNAEA